MSSAFIAARPQLLQPLRLEISSNFLLAAEAAIASDFTARPVTKYVWTRLAQHPVLVCPSEYLDAGSFDLALGC
jgi:hypothetical protein